MSKPKKRKKGKIESVVITLNKVYSHDGKQIGRGFTIARKDGHLMFCGADGQYGNELTPGWYDVRHDDIEFIGVACWGIQ